MHSKLRRIDSKDIKKKCFPKLQHIQVCICNSYPAVCLLQSLAPMDDKANCLEQPFFVRRKLADLKTFFWIAPVINTLAHAPSFQAILVHPVSNAAWAQTML
ncbi:MAG: hypothetical protein A2Z21_03745 [Candidatus Fraserbacteria bacterium RBG_16_55_9]|uniref:Uncharacterized protein n=1 Tax=Fraserbacteria sp. (strain RBG_16_55_9) TaxID=1817864 RepID=A0A1F5UNG0_FRAXR|nr:MAG: hypothetical protein A2Z21_03745 [Candidatus Fraserbacteria bacterium RBG_16_55_9]